MKWIASLDNLYINGTFLPKFFAGALSSSYFISWKGHRNENDFFWIQFLLCCNFQPLPHMNRNCKSTTSVYICKFSVDGGIDYFKNKVSFINWLKDFKPPRGSRSRNEIESFVCFGNLKLVKKELCQKCALVFVLVWRKNVWLCWNFWGKLLALAGREHTNIHIILINARYILYIYSAYT